jgi:pimeloyl-ACP methyl ester carboxylesterase
MLPGTVLPARQAYTPLVDALGDRVDVALKDLELYRDDVPPPGYSLALEADGIVAEADRRGFERFHLVGYSGGGAVGLVLAAAQPERLLSLALLEPAWAGNERTPREQALYERFFALDRLSPDDQLTEFARLQLAPGVEPPPPPDDPPAWLALRPAGITAIMRAFDAAELDLDGLRAFTQPVYFALGGRSNPDYFAQLAERLAAVFPDFRLETFPERHHFDPPHRVESERVAASLLALWERAES